MRAILPLALVLAGCSARAAEAPDDAAVVALGRSLFFDDAISLNGNQSCAACHGPAVGWTGPDERLNEHGTVYQGSVPGRFGNRKPTTVAYATFAPVFHLDRKDRFVGGNFWDGRATGEVFGNPAIDQAQGPPLNPLEQALPDAAAVTERVCASAAAAQFRAVWGDEACTDADRGFEAFARSVAAYEGSDEVSPFSSKFDAVRAGRATLRPIEAQGFALYGGKGRCASCHALTGATSTAPPLFTDFTYDNIGVPRNVDNPFYLQAEFNPEGPAWVDEGLGGFLRTRPEWADRAEGERGRHKVPTLRNVDARPGRDFVKAFGHNGYFKSLEEIVHFYNTRDALPRCEPGTPGERVSCWPAPEVSANLNMEIGRLGLTAHEERALVAFLRTLSDGWAPTASAGP